MTVERSPKTAFDKDTCEEATQFLNFLEVSSVILDERAFKVQLDVGEDAYASLRVRNSLADAWEIGGAAITGAAAAKSGIVATTFFPAGGLLGLAGLGTAATPMGWVIAAAAISGASWLFIRKKVMRATSGLVEVVPKFINSPIDVLGLALLDLMMPLALKISAVDGELHQVERTKIWNYFVKKWGYEPKVVLFAMTYVEADLQNFRISDLAGSLVKFTRQNQDCCHKSILKKIMSFLNELIEADERIHEHEELALKEVHRIFKRARR